ncbi:MAG: porin family protein, partial [Acidobacteriota bacterium]|nr:porin family protein [Acidobacteriota bacterium]
MRRASARRLWLLGVLLAASPAAAQTGPGLFSGQATGHVGVATGTNGRGSTVSLGASVSVVDGSGWGAELDFGYADDDNGRTGGLDVQSYMLNVIGIRPKGRVRPFVVAGGGVVRARTCAGECPETRAWTDWGVSAGGGVQYRLTPVAALRADVRYLAAPADHPEPERVGGFGFWRVAVGATFLW